MNKSVKISNAEDFVEKIIPSFLINVFIVKTSHVVLKTNEEENTEVGVNASKPQITILLLES